MCPFYKWGNKFTKSHSSRVVKLQDLDSGVLALNLYFATAF